MKLCVDLLRCILIHTVLAFLVTEVLGNGQTSEGNTGTGSGRLVHLTENEGDLGLSIELDNTGFLHFVVQVISFTGPLADTSEHGVTTVGFGNVVLFELLEKMTTPKKFVSFSIDRVWGGGTYDQFLNEDSFSDTGTSEETNLSTTSVRSEEVDDLDTSDKDLSGGGLFDVLWGFSVDWGLLGVLDGPSLINGVTSDVHDTAKGARADGNHNGGTSVGNSSTTDETLGT